MVCAVARRPIRGPGVGWLPGSKRTVESVTADVSLAFCIHIAISYSVDPMELLWKIRSDAQKPLQAVPILVTPSFLMNRSRCDAEHGALNQCYAVVESSAQRQPLCAQRCPNATNWAASCILRFQRESVIQLVHIKVHLYNKVYNPDARGEIWMASFSSMRPI
jgi:hypothetical protein